MFTLEEIKHIADLARIELSEQSTEQYREQLGRVLDYMEKIKEVNTLGVATADGGTRDLENVWREDEIRTQNPINNTQENILINMAPDVEQGQVKVKSVF